MNYYRYKLIETNGMVLSGVIKLPYKDIMSVISYLEREGRLTIYVKKMGLLGSMLLKLFSLKLKRRSLSRSDLSELLNNMALMLRSGMPLTTALEESAVGSEISDVASDINDIILNIKGGMTFSEAAQNYPRLFPKNVLYLIRMGEETGRLDKMLKDAAEHLKRMQTIISDTKQALLYPVFVFIAMGAGIGFWFYYVVPRIVTLFSEMDVTLPAVTVLLIKVSDFINNYALFILAVIIAVILTVASIHKASLGFRKLCDSFLLKLPVVGTILTASILAFITEYFAMLMNAGVELMKSISILSDSVKNEIYSEKMVNIGKNIAKGESIADSFTKAEIFPTFVIRMINIGEISGNMTEQLNYISQEYSNKLRVLVATLGKMIEPIVLITAGIIFAVMIGALLLPVYDLVGGVSG